MMSLLNFAAIGVGLVLLSLVIYFATRRLVMRSAYKGAPKAKPPASEPLYETPMPKVKAVQTKENEPEKNPLLDFISEWQEPKPTPKPEVLRATAEKVPEAEKPPPKIETIEDKPTENPLLKFIEEWEEPKPTRKAKKKK